MAPSELYKKVTNRQAVAFTVNGLNSSATVHTVLACFVGASQQPSVWTRVARHAWSTRTVPPTGMTSVTSLATCSPRRTPLEEPIYPPSIGMATPDQSFQNRRRHRSISKLKVHCIRCTSLCLVSSHDIMIIKTNQSINLLTLSAQLREHWRHF